MNLLPRTRPDFPFPCLRLVGPPVLARPAQVVEGSAVAGLVPAAPFGPVEPVGAADAAGQEEESVGAEDGGRIAG